LSDKYGFNALPAGFRMDELLPDDGLTEYYVRLGEVADFWTSNNFGTTAQLYNRSHYIMNAGSKSYGHSVRCIKD